MVVLFIFNEGNTKFIPIGSEDNTGFIILLDNDTGKIVKENYETRSMRAIASSLSELISELKPSIIDYEV